jgi:hypothetical protein
MCHQKRLHTDHGRGVDDLDQLRMHRYFEMRFLAAFRLALVDTENAIVDVLATNLYDIAPTQPGVEDQGEGKPRLGANRVCALEAPDIRLRPCLLAGGLGLHAGHAERWVIGNAAFSHRPFEHGA